MAGRPIASLHYWEANAIFQIPKLISLLPYWANLRLRPGSYFLLWVFGSRALALTEPIKHAVSALKFFFSFTGHQRLPHDPHFIKRNPHHYQKACRHEGVAGKHG